MFCFVVNSLYHISAGISSFFGSPHFNTYILQKKLHGNFPAFCAALPVPVSAAAVVCAWIPNIKRKDTVYVSLLL